MTDRTKTICPPIFDIGGIKIKLYKTSLESPGKVLARISAISDLSAKSIVSRVMRRYTRVVAEKY